jgi:hypothetical protein
MLRGGGRIRFLRGFAIIEVVDLEGDLKMADAWPTSRLPSMMCCPWTSGLRRVAHTITYMPFVLSDSI